MNGPFRRSKQFLNAVYDGGKGARARHVSSSHKLVGSHGGVDGSVLTVPGHVMLRTSPNLPIGNHR